MKADYVGTVSIRKIGSVKNVRANCAKTLGVRKTKSIKNMTNKDLPGASTMTLMM